MTETPAMRAAHVQSNLAALDLLGPGPRALVLAAFEREHPRALEAIKRALPLAWLPIEYDITLTEAVAQQVGAPAARRWTADARVASLDGRMFRSAVRSARSLFGMGPAGLLKLAPRVYNLIYRNFGEARIVLDTEHSSATISFLGLPRRVARSPAFHASLMGTVDAAMRLSDATSVRVDVSNTADQIVIATSWRPNARRAA